MINNKQRQSTQLTLPRNFIISTSMCLAISLGLLSTTASAESTGHIKLTSKVEKMVMVNQNGKQVPTYIPAAKVLPGETIQYSTYLQNISQQSADGISIDNPIPAHTVYLANSAYGKNMNITFSVNGGRHYGLPATLKINGNDGKLYPAKASDYTHIRWQYKGRLSPKEIRVVGFKTRLL